MTGPATVTTIDPATGKTLATYAGQSWADVDAVLDGAEGTREFTNQRTVYLGA